ncbi:MAG: hypothetical protein FJX94_06080 [Bacteroidetes bacterium]|nr:hypothetical protein [Bacteroidota bacterium]
MKTFLLSITLSIAATLLQAQDLQPWKINLPAGVRLQVQTKSNASITQEMMGQNMEMQSLTEVTERIQLKANANNTVGLEKQITAMRMEMSMMGQEMKFDSNNPDDFNSPVGMQMKPMLERTVTASIDAAGNIIVSSSSVDEPNISAALGMFGDGVPDSLALAGLFMKPTTQSIKPGASWTETYHADGMKQETKYTYLETKDQLASIAFEINSTIEKTTEMQGTTLTTNTKTQSKGTLKLELGTGMVVSRTLEQTVEGTNNVMGMEIPLKGGGKTEITISRIN